MIVIAAQFSDTITLGSVIIGVIIGLAGLAVLGYGARWKAAYETEKVTAATLAEGRAAFKERSAQLESELYGAIVEATALKIRVETLEQATDLSAATAQMHEEHTVILKGIEHLAEMLKHMTSQFPLTNGPTHEIEAHGRTRK